MGITPSAMEQLGSCSGRINELPEQLPRKLNRKKSSRKSITGRGGSIRTSHRPPGRPAWEGHRIHIA